MQRRKKIFIGLFSLFVLTTLTLAALYRIFVVDCMDCGVPIPREKVRMEDLETALKQYQRRHGVYPSTEQGLKALIEKPVTGKIPENYPLGGYLKSLPRDSWDRPYFYESPGSNGHPYEITSWGRDGKRGGTGQDEDVHSWELHEEEETKTLGLPAR